MKFNKKNLLGFVLVLTLLTVMSVVSANLVPTTAPCWVKGTVTSSDFTVDTLTVDAYLGTTLLKSSSVSSDGVYDLNSLGANDGDTINLKVDGATFDTFTFVGYCNTSGNPWVVENFLVSKQANGQSCSSDEICTSAYCSDDNLCDNKPVETRSSGGSGNLSNRSIQVANIWPVVNAQVPIVMNITDDKLGLVQVKLMLGVTKENVRIKITSLFDKPSSLPKFTGNVYLYLKIDKTNFENNDLAKIATIRFKVEKSWLKENGLSAEDVTLYRFTQQWDKLTTKVLSEDDEFVYFEAETPGFSYFAIVGDEPLNASTKEGTNSSSDLNNKKNADATNKKDSKKQKNEVGTQTTKTRKNTVSIIILIVVLVLLVLFVIYLFNRSKKSNRSMSHIRSVKRKKFKK